MKIVAISSKYKNMEIIEDVDDFINRFDNFATELYNIKIIFVNSMGDLKNKYPEYKIVNLIETDFKEITLNEYLKLDYTSIN